MKLMDFRGKPPTYRRNLRSLERAGRDHDLIGLVDTIAGVHDEAHAIVLERANPRVETHRQVESLRVSR